MQVGKGLRWRADPDSGTRPCAVESVYTVRTPHWTVSPRPGTPPGLLFARVRHDAQRHDLTLATG